jgi:hypothetical protein
VILSINSPSEGEEVYSKMITVFGTAAATEGRYIVSVTVDNLPAGKETWSKIISLDAGKNTIKIVATDNFGNNNTTTRIVDYIDSTPSPTFTTISNGGYRPAATPAPTPAPTVSISITSIPSGANVWLDDSFKGTTPIRENVTVGYHKIKVTKEGYDSYSETKKIRLGDGEPQEMIIELEPLTASIYVFSTPSGASVYLDDVYKRDTNTNCTLSEVVVGPHTITLKKSGYFDEPTNKYVSADGPTSLHVTLRRCGYINISSNPPGANVSLDGNDRGETTPANISKVALGNHTIRLTKFGYYNNETKVDVSVAKTYHVDVNLRGYGYINIFSDPDGARVYLDGEYTQKKTPTNISKGVGNYSIRLTKRNYKNVTQEIQVSAGNTTPVDEYLSLTFWGGKEDWIPLYVIIIGLIISFILVIRFEPIIPFSRKEKYLLNWDSVPGNDDEKFKKSLRDYFDIGWAENAEIIKLEDGKTIRIFKDEYSAEIIIDEKKEKASLKISDGRTLDLKIKKENGKLNIYKKRKN